ncbi:thiamine phosphate synthase [Alcaligenes sp. SDU_A2]|uniref:thiamine phosphate synthase n=1 Tax=Alcaligenes sp. SDU_A2 TaxID=3136634 RepID=UPI002B61BADD|nr:thiamine phosphate synthase [Alcaligenes sp.]HRL28028.1 thiamine phosphate synthase [Alcaligenes sp.]
MTDTTPLRFPAGLYGITPDWDDTPRLLRAVQAAHDGGLKVLQFRRKKGDKQALRQQLTQLAELCASLALPLLINDHWAWALQYPVQGAHLGKDDGDLIQARHTLGQHALLGRSCYNSIALARQALDQGADYIAFGAMFPSSVKPDAPRAELDTLRQARLLCQDQSRSKRAAVVAIGGITPDNAAALIHAGVDSVAVISSLFDTPDVRATAQRFTDLFRAQAQH